MANNNYLDGQYTVFGRVITGMKRANSLRNTPSYTSGQYQDQPLTLSSSRASQSRPLRNQEIVGHDLATVPSTMMNLKNIARKSESAYREDLSESLPTWGLT